MGEDYPGEVAASSSCHWPLLGLPPARLRLDPGRLLVDAGCGTGGIGLWLVRALGADRRPAFGLTAARAAFYVADFEDPGLAPGAAGGIVCVDALGRASDRTAAVVELAPAPAPAGC
ncbi:hypothetical protein [Streptomyces sp. NPDC047097]|uniref:hypothetical protein n=1 Tax=Streptomyces sp. NPDC047097 TaxID=3155260 RepID=UPI0033EBFCBC